MSADTGTTGATAPHVDHSAVAERVNDELRFTMWSVWRTAAPLAGDAEEVDALAASAETAVTSAGADLRGWYDVGGFRADADLMAWWHAPDVESVQAAYHALRASTLGAVLEPVWSVVAVHRPAEFNRGHVPAFLAGDDPKGFLCVYPFVRSYEWYLLPDDERRTLLREHGMAARDYGDVLANTVATFALSDYEWILAFEADELVRIVDLMRELRATDARRHVREEVPFFTGPRVELPEWAGRQPFMG
ncbi:Chlorite dismutase [Beutenbergia cavernae DSM 12333]|uniref:Coproheme decarboxylase n=1 Tax=Beutenbergia cavernae (strain ATCC BAA-8 / DSM 12333 / CCUG 43141 / JCM 11478 / NBRC 16432 / NCIMB 13614 / HKI 0122) TaxID=471853 RepID=C5C0U5_BEUC1|nr:hydrogen peroxide-dependent heme synthase [Beutenbergia cavernae]ACQ79349.1 Chlorite dismutase [Beutenbergia cavernae DSM 12333]